MRWGGELPNSDTEGPNEMGGPAVTKVTLNPIATHPTQHRVPLTSWQRHSSKRTRQGTKETPGVLNAEKVIMSNMEVSDVK